MTDRAPWSIASPDPAAVDRLARDLSVGRPAAACLVNRGYLDLGRTRAFLTPQLADLDRPDGMADLDRAAARVAEAVAAKERVGVFGDYDVDGITSAALVTAFLTDLGTTVHGEIASRFGVGYGLSRAAVERFADLGCRTLVVLDCGTTDHAALARAAELGLDAVVVDHHRVEGAHPPAVAFVNPERADCRFPDKNLAAVGLAFYFVAAVRRALERQGRLREGEIDLRELLDLVALGTVADVVSLTRNNRILVHHGLKVLSETRRPGLRALMRHCRLRARRLRAEHVTFQLAPRLNAAGRLGDARDAYSLLIARRARDAHTLAERLDALTRRRREVEEHVDAEARRRIEDEALAGESVIVVGGDGWHRGVIGIVAARIAERYGRPAFVVGFDGDEGIGSARGQGQLDLHGGLAAAREHLLRFGGHHDAAGFTLRRDALAGLREALVGHARDHARPRENGKTVCDARITSRELTGALLEEIGRIGPFGHDNPEPVFDVDALPVLSRRVVGGDHLKLELKTPSGSVGAFGPRMGASVAGVPPLVRVAAAVGADEWRGDRTLELRLVEPPAPAV